MSDTGLNFDGKAEVLHSGGSLSDYFALLKPRVMSLVIFTGLVGMVAAPGNIHPFMAFVALLCIAVGAGASGALNMWYDADIDAKMQRTAARPIPKGNITPDEALSFGVVLSCFSIGTLGLLVNVAAGLLLAITIGFYVFIYTMWLKRSTPQNIVIGGAAGAFPPMIGWAAVTGSVSLESIILFLIIFMWTPPHFWALALYRSRDYERAGVPMLPVVSGQQETKKQIVIYTILLLATTVAPIFIGLGGLVYAITSCALGFVFLALSISLYRASEETSLIKNAKSLFAFSIFYLFAIFAVILMEHSLPVKFSVMEVLS